VSGDVLADSWRELHEAFRHELAGLVTQADSLVVANVEAFTERFAFFAQELRVHSEVEDGILFPALADRGHRVEGGFTEDHHDEQRRIYDLGSSLYGIASLADRFEVTDAVEAVQHGVRDLGTGLERHFDWEERDVLPVVASAFDGEEQSWLLGRIIAVLPADPRVQPWVTASLSPAHRDVRLRHLHDSLPHEAFVATMRQIREGVPPEVWADIEARQPDLVVELTKSPPS